MILWLQSYRVERKKSSWQDFFDALEDTVPVRLPLFIVIEKANPYIVFKGIFRLFIRSSSWVLANSFKDNGRIINAYCSSMAGTLHKKWSFTLRISSVNVTPADLVTLTEEILNGKLHFSFSGMSEICNHVFATLFGNSYDNRIGLNNSSCTS